MPGRLRLAGSQKEEGVEKRKRGENRGRNRITPVGKHADVVSPDGNFRAVSLYSFQTNEAPKSDIMIRAANMRYCKRAEPILIKAASNFALTDPNFILSKIIVSELIDECLRRRD